MPHCCPQKQQCVFTSFSVSAPASARIPCAYARCGPKRSITFELSVGTVAMHVCSRSFVNHLSIIPHLPHAPDIYHERTLRSSFRLQNSSPSPHPSLRHRQHLPATCRADMLIVAHALVIHFVAIAELALDHLQILDMDRRGILGAASNARGHRLARAHLTVERDAELRGTLEDVEELSEREPEERDDHRERV